MAGNDIDVSACDGGCVGEIDAVIERFMAELDRADEVLDKTGMPPLDARLQ